MVKSLWVSAALAAVVGIPSAASAGWVIEWKNTPIRKDIRQDSQKSTARIDGNRSRIDQEHLTTIYDYKKSKFTILNPKMQYYWSGSIDEYVRLSAKRRNKEMRKKFGVANDEDQADLPALDEDALPEVKIELSGETKEVAGHQTTKYTILVNQNLFQEVWIAPDLDLSDDIDPEKYVSYQKKSSRGMIGASAVAYHAVYRSPAYTDLLRKGFPLETVTHHIAGQFEQSARSIRSGAVDSSIYEAPEGYRKVRLSDVFRVAED